MPGRVRGGGGTRRERGGSALLCSALLCSAVFSRPCEAALERQGWSDRGRLPSAQRRRGLRTMMRRRRVVSRSQGEICPRDRLPGAVPLSPGMRSALRCAVPRDALHLRAAPPLSALLTAPHRRRSRPRSSAVPAGPGSCRSVPRALGCRSPLRSVLIALNKERRRFSNVYLPNYLSFNCS